MNSTTRSTATVCGALILLMTAWPGAVATADDELPPLNWPREIDVPEAKVVIYQPQPESFEDNQVTARAAVSVTPTGKTDQTEEEIKVGRAVAEALSKQLVKYFERIGMKAERAVEDSPPTPTTLRIGGQFLTVEGDRTQRMLIGFGLGASKVQTHVMLFQDRESDRHLIRTFDTSAKSTLRPGLIVPAAVGVGAATGSEVFRDTVEANAKKTAKLAVKELTRYFLSQGWITPEQAKKI